MSKDTEKTDKTTTQERVVASAIAYVRQRFDAELAPTYLYHNFTYAEEVAEAVAELATDSGLGATTVTRLTIAGYFYPLGYVGGEEGVAERSAAALRDWAEEENYALKDADIWLPQIDSAQPDSALEVRLLHDAAYGWLGRKRFERRANLLRLEREARTGREGDPVVFFNEILERLVNFRYLTVAGKRSYDKRRRRNAAAQHDDNYKITQNEMKARTGKNFGRGIDTMYRTAFRNHINLSRIADGKANMMISINTIILSIVITVSGASLSFFEETFFENPEFLIPIISLLLSSLIAVVFAVFSARPSVTEYRIKKDKLVKSTEASMLYFGNFLKLEKGEFIDYMKEMKLDQDLLYDDLARDLYDLGAVMHKKYLLLTISYNTFVGGLALAVVSFLIVYLLNIL